MKYIIQINTGTLNNNEYTLDEIIGRLDFITSCLDVTMVIFGWYSNIEFNRTICNYLRSKNIKSIFKLPIFSEITNLNEEDDYIYYKDELNVKNTHFYKGDQFDFVCPSSKKNVDYILNVFDDIDNYVNFDGVFFDRIRYPASSVKKTSIYGCQCDKCKEMYKDINIDNIKTFKPLKRVGMHYEYFDENANKLMNVKRQIITNQVKYLSNHFKNKIIGIDTFALNLADLVGQDLEEISKFIDFIKPMNYLKTFAPAGIPYEMDGLDGDIQEEIKKLWINDVLSIDSSVEMSKELLKLNNRIAIGIDANFVNGICDADVDYVVKHVKKLDENGINEVVLSWNSMLLCDELIYKLNKNIK